MTVDVMVKDTPLLMKGPLVCATLEDRKTQTRRTNGLDEINSAPDSWEYIGYTGNARHMFRLKDSNPLTIKCPYGKQGDRLWVRETWSVSHKRKDSYTVVFKADFDKGPLQCMKVDVPFTDLTPEGVQQAERAMKKAWTPSIHMPRWASRINLEIVGIRVERVQDISDIACADEGINLQFIDDAGPINIGAKEIPGAYRQAFQKLWDSINAKRGYGWDKNLWVWVVEFKRLEVPGE